ncbi:MAG: hypothetical protein IH987_12110 [Planctomycetes bacterium]|nr:hypothetical protein [Planctomycetota bacterium]
MKKIYVGLMAIGAVVGPFAAESVIHAEDAKRVETVERQTQGDDEAAWAAWRDDFWARLSADEEYVTAEGALKAHEGADQAEYARLEAVVNDRYREIARVVYEEYFDVWEGDDAGFDELIGGRDGSTPAQKKVLICDAIGARCKDDSNPDNMEWCKLWFKECAPV